MKNILQDAIERKGLRIHSIEPRAKTIESFGVKAMMPSEQNPTQPKYPEPLRNITDLAGVRVITFFPRTVDEVGTRIREEFEVLEQVDHRTAAEKEERLGYQSVHFIVRLARPRINLPEYARYLELVAEIQVRTVMQHAWAEIEHDIQYKSSTTIPTAIRRRFMALAGMLEIADREFQAIQDADLDVRRQARESIRSGTLEEVEITADALHAYLDSKFGKDYRIAPYTYEWAAELVRAMGFINFKQLDECVGAYNADEISRHIHGTIQGQVTRFEDLLLAGMGENFVRLHRFTDLEWFKDSCERKLKKLKAAGVTIGSYLPTKSAASTGTVGA